MSSQTSCLISDNAAYRNLQRRTVVDFSAVPAAQQDMHRRLDNWGNACFARAGTTMAPMFRQFVPAQHWVSSAPRSGDPIDHEDARIVGLGVYGLPEPHRVALHWYYVKRTAISQGRRALSCTAEALARYVIDGRTMLINRGV